MELKPSIGIGDITLSMTCAEVKHLMGESLTEYRKMDFIEHYSLYYKGFSICFSDTDGRHPTPNAKIHYIEIDACTLFGQDPFEMIGLDIQTLLSQKSIESRWYEQDADLISVTGCLYFNCDSETEKLETIEMSPMMKSYEEIKKPVLRNEPTTYSNSPLKIIRKLLGME